MISVRLKDEAELLNKQDKTDKCKGGKEKSQMTKGNAYGVPAAKGKKGTDDTQQVLARNRVAVGPAAKQVPPNPKPCAQAGDKDLKKEVATQRVLARA